MSEESACKLQSRIRWNHSKCSIQVCRTFGAPEKDFVTPVCNLDELTLMKTWTTAWKNASPKMRGLNDLWMHASKLAWRSLKNVERKFNFKPFGGSVTTENHSILSKLRDNCWWETLLFKDRCSIPMGKEGVGSVVIHNLNSGCGDSNFSNCFSKFRMNAISKWPFCNINHCPRFVDISNRFRAAWHWRKLIDYLIIEHSFCHDINKIRRDATHPFLSLSKWNMPEISMWLSTTISKFHQIASWIRSWTQNEHNRNHVRSLLVDIVKTNDWWCYVKFSHYGADILINSTENPVYAEAT